MQIMIETDDYPAATLVELANVFAVEIDRTAISTARDAASQTWEALTNAIMKRRGHDYMVDNTICPEALYE